MANWASHLWMRLASDCFFFPFFFVRLFLFVCSSVRRVRAFFQSESVIDQVKRDGNQTEVIAWKTMHTKLPAMISLWRRIDWRTMIFSTNAAHSPVAANVLFMIRPLANETMAGASERTRWKTKVSQTEKRYAPASGEEGTGSSSLPSRQNLRRVFVKETTEQQSKRNRRFSCN